MGTECRIKGWVSAASSKCTGSWVMETQNISDDHIFANCKDVNELLYKVHPKSN
jgi:hypothetical protein